jgi:GNAT superfamily N-acetyltransferase
MPDVVAVLADAFHDYPVMRFIVGPGHADYDRRLHELISFFVFRRMRQGGPMLGVRDAHGALVGAAVMTLPVEPEAPADVLARRAALWRDLGDDARTRYETYAHTTKPFMTERPHHHLNMIGVRQAHAGRGVARPLLDAVAEISGDDSGSSGVSLTTEVARNVTLYERFGYRVTGHAQVSPDLETWGMFLSRRPPNHP